MTVSINSHSQQRGFSLVEILMAMLVFSIGMGGYLALQVKSVSLGNDAYLRTQATHLADYMTVIINTNDKSWVTRTTTTQSVTFGVGQNQQLVNVSESLIVPQAKNLYFDSPEAQAAWSDAVSDYSDDCYQLNNTDCDDLQELAVTEINNIRMKAQQLLPNGDITITDCNEAENNLCIVVAWRNTDLDDCLGTATITAEMDCLYRKANF